jgi:hypothetical protein
MFDTFEGNMEGCYLYSAILSSNLYLDKAMAAMEGTETANVSASEWEPSHYFIAIVRLELFQVELYMEERMLFLKTSHQDLVSKPHLLTSQN